MFMARRVDSRVDSRMVETMLFIVDVDSALNHRTVKTAKVLDRALRAKGAAAQANALEALRIHPEIESNNQHDADDQDGRTVVWETDKLCIVGLRTCKHVTDEQNQ